MNKMKLIKRLIEKHKADTQSRKDARYRNMCNIRERNSKIYIMLGDYAIKSVSPTTTCDELVAMLNETRAAKDDYCDDGN